MSLQKTTPGSHIWEGMFFLIPGQVFVTELRFCLVYPVQSNLCCLFLPTCQPALKSIWKWRTQVVLDLAEKLAGKHKKDLQAKQNKSLGCSLSREPESVTDG